MKRTPLTRTTPMPRGTSQLRRTPFPTHGGSLERGAPLQRTAPIQPRRARKTKADQANECPELLIGEDIAKEVTGGRSGGWCEIRFPGCFGRALDWHHRLHHGQGGLWQASNGLHLCRWCHEKVTNTRGHRALYEEHGWIVRSRTVPGSVKALIHYQGQHTWFYLHDDGQATLAPFPESVSGDPFTLPVPAVDDVVLARKRGVA